MFNNKNINNVILDYLTPADLSKVEQVNKILNKSCKSFNYKWKQACEEHFLLISEIMPLNTEENPYLQGIQNKINKNSVFNYKKIFEKGISIYNQWGADKNSKIKTKETFKLKKTTDELLSMKQRDSSKCVIQKKLDNFLDLSNCVNDDKHEYLIQEDLINVRNEVFYAYKCKITILILFN